MSASSPKQKRHHALELSRIERKRNSMAAPLDDVALARGPSCTGGEMEGREGDAGRRHPKSSFPVSSRGRLRNPGQLRRPRSLARCPNPTLTSDPDRSVGVGHVVSSQNIGQKARCEPEVDGDESYQKFNSERSCGSDNDHYSGHPGRSRSSRANRRRGLVRGDEPGGRRDAAYALWRDGGRDEYIHHHRSDSSNYGNVAQAAAVIERDAKSLPKLFPPGTSQNDGFHTAASDAIWTDREGFNRLAGQLATEAAKLAMTNPSSDSAEVQNQMNVVIDICQSCHRAYRRK